MARDIKHFVSKGGGDKDLKDDVPRLKAHGLDLKYMSEDDRLSLPCEEPIDLRDMFPTTCYPCRQNGITHFFDTTAEIFFTKQMKRSNGRYTQAVYEAVLKHSSARLASHTYSDLNSEFEVDEIEDSIAFPKVIPVGYSQYRQENRLNFATDVEIELPSGTIVGCRSVDISPSGIQLKLNKLIDVIEGMDVNMVFPALEEKYECQFGSVPYRLMKSAIGSMYMTLKLVRIDPGEHAFDLFLQQFIESKKHRYRIDSEDSKQALTAKAWEYLYTKALPYLACFVSIHGEAIQIQEIAISESGKRQVTGLGNSMLSFMEQKLTSFRLNGIAHKDTGPQEIYAYRYQGDGIRRRLCAASWGFSDQKSKLAFLRAGINEDSFKAWRLNVIKLKEMSEQRSSELLEKLAAEEPEQAKSLMQQLSHYEYLIYLVDIRDNLLRDPLLQHDDSMDVVEDSFFDKFEIKRRSSAEYTRLRLGITKQRNEERYIYNSPILLRFYGETIKGHTLDLSINGLKIALEKTKSFQIRDTVSIDFVGFNKKFRSSKLNRQSYRVAAITRDGSLCLTRDHRIGQHKAAIFLGKLLKKNKEILPTCTGELWMSSKSRLMESWLNLCLPTQGLLMTREDGVYNIPYLLSGTFTPQLLAPFKIGQDFYNFQSLLQHRMIKEKLRALRVDNGVPVCTEIYVSLGEGKNNSAPEVNVRFWSDFKDDIERIEYLKWCCNNPVFGFYNLSFTRVPRLDKSTLIEDMNVIRRNARHQLREFENECKSLVAILELSDFTDLISRRYNLRNIKRART